MLLLGIAHHLGWAVAVTATPDHEVVDRRRIELVEPGLPAAPIHHEGGAHPLHQGGRPRMDDDALAALVSRVRASALRTASAALEDLAAGLPAPIGSISLAAWPADMPAVIAALRAVPHESRADSVMYRQVLAEVAGQLGWALHRYDPKGVEAEASRLLGDRAHQVLRGPRDRLGPPWAKDHRTALAATVLAEAQVT